MVPPETDVSVSSSIKFITYQIKKKLKSLTSCVTPKYHKKFCYRLERERDWTVHRAIREFIFQNL